LVASPAAWSLPLALLVLGVATALATVTTSLLVGSLEGFSDQADTSEFFISVILFALVATVADQSGASVLARRGELALATESAVASSAQVACLLVPVVVLLSFAISPPLPLSFRPVEVVGMVCVPLFAVWLLVIHSNRTRGLALIVAYAGMAIALFITVPDR
jgi:Ca2+:H+ antiporter